MSDAVLSSLITGILTLIGSGVLSFIISKRNARRDDFSTITDLMKEDNNRLRQEVEKNKEELDRVEKERTEDTQKLRNEIDDLRKRLSEEENRYNGLKSELLLLETAHHDLPIPQSLTDAIGIMIAVNDAFVEAFLEPMGHTRADMVGKTDLEYWGEEIGTEYQRNDLVAKTRRRPVAFRERIEISGVDFSSDYVILKYPRYKGRTLIGVGRVYFPVSYYDSMAKN